MKILPIITICLLGFVCCTRKEAPADATIGKYIFIGDNYIIHKSEACHALRYGHDEEGHRAYGKSYVDTLNFDSDEGLSYCTHCITKTDYERIKNIIKSNRK